jgi:hypothetical protein
MPGKLMANRASGGRRESTRIVDIRQSMRRPLPSEGCHMDSSNLFSHPEAPEHVAAGEGSRKVVEYPTFSDRPDADEADDRRGPHPRTGTQFLFRQR